MATVAVNGVELFYELTGDPDGEPVLLIAGLGVQMIDWPTYFVEPLVDAGYRVIRYDNRDIGLSTTFPDGFDDPLKFLELALTGQPLPELAYTLQDMGDDAAALLTALDISAAHVIGSSMGGMIAQDLAIRHPDRVRTLTSIMSTSGNPSVGQPTAAAFEAISTLAAGDDYESYIAHGLVIGETWASPDHFDEEELRRQFEADWKRVGGSQAANNARQMCAIVNSSERDEGLGKLTIPALVIHGTSDPLIQPDGGAHTAACIPNAELLSVPGMGHDLARAFCPQIIEAITSTMARG